MKLLVTGGAGYIGSHAVQRLVRDGHEVTVVDSLVTGHRAAVDPSATLHELDLRDTPALTELMLATQPDAVLHFAALSIVGESVQQPLRYWDNNVGGAISLLSAMAAGGVERLIFSSTCSTYGEPERMPIREDAPQAPINTYGRTKLAVEGLIQDHAAARPGFSYAMLRYFNVAGCDRSGRLGEDHRPETHLVPIVLQAAAGLRDGVAIFGTDYDTPDGTCVRDYLHVDDLVAAHVCALERLRPGRGDALNLGVGRGYSVRELLAVAKRVTGVDFPVTEAPRRSGDVPVLYADPSRALVRLGWAPECSDLETILSSAWRWHQAHPEGYA